MLHLILICSLLLNIVPVDSFTALPQPEYKIGLVALMARRGPGPGPGPGPTSGGGGGASKGKAKRQNDPKTGAKKKKGNAGGVGGSVPSRAAQMNNRKNQSSHAPPWQVVSKKDQAKNIKAEKERRKLAQEQGIHNVKEELSYQVSTSFLSAEDKGVLAWKRFSQSPQDEIDFIGAYLNKQLPPRLGAPEVAFLGRSNVGKSSLLNQLVGSDSARVGKTPGATASVNLYGMFRKDKAMLGLVDLPGFGYAKLSKEAKESVQQAAENYLGKRKELMLGILLVDIRRKPSDDDRAVLAALFDMGVPIIVVATKVDKLSKTHIDGALQGIQEGLGLPEGQPFCVSSMTGKGVKELWRIIMEVCETGVAELRSKMEKGASDERTSPEPVEYLEEDDDISYSQGFDWIHDSASVMYEEGGGEVDYEGGDDREDGDREHYYEDEKDSSNEEAGLDPNQKLPSMKYLKQKAKDMEERGEL